MDEYQDIPSSETNLQASDSSLSSAESGNSDSAADNEPESVEEPENSYQEPETVESVAADYTADIQQVKELLVYQNYLTLALLVFLLVAIGFMFGNAVFHQFEGK